MSNATKTLSAITIATLAGATSSGWEISSYSLASTAQALGADAPDAAMLVRSGVIFRAPNGWQLARELRDPSLLKRYEARIAPELSFSEWSEARAAWFTDEKARALA